MSAGAGVTTLRVATLNTWGLRADWQARRRRMRQGFAGIAADVVTLQEDVLTSAYDQAADVLGDAYRVVHSREREADGAGVTVASRWPVGRVVELDLNVTERTADFACTTLVTEVLAPEPLGRVWLANHFPSWEPAHEHERELQAVVAARALEDLVTASPGHVVVAGDFDADPDATSVRFWTGRHASGGTSVCYRDAWASARGDERGGTFVPSNPYSADWDWPFRRIDYVLVRCGTHGGPTLAVERCDRVFASPDTVVSDHYGLVADLRLP